MSFACDQALVSNILDSYQAAGPLFVQTLQSFLAAQCALVGDQLWPDDALDAVLDDPNYDFIVVGAGSAGSVVANRLSENPEWKVLLVEAGGNPALSTEIPQLFNSNMGTRYVWNHHTQPQENACRGYKTKGCYVPQGKCIGGSSSVNALFYIRGNKADYNNWAANGFEGWSYEDVLPYFLKIENFNGNITEANQIYHSHTGPVNVVQEADPTPIESMILEASTQLGVERIDEVNGATQMGTSIAESNIKNKYRVSTARAYLSPAKERKNLHVLKHTYATQILFDSEGRAEGLLLNKYGNNITVHATKEIIVSCGTFKTPQLLMLSGLGPKEYLEEMNIKVVADLPVGQNLQDHIYAPTFYSKQGNENSTSLSFILESLVNYMIDGTGPFKDTRSNRVVTFVNTADPESSVPNMQYHYLVLPPSSSNLVDFYNKHGLSDEFQHKFHKMNEEKFIVVPFSILLHPKSKGNVTLASNNPFDEPIINTNYFSDPEDIAQMVKGMKYHSVRLGETKAFIDAGFKLDWIDLDACRTYEINSDDHLACIARELTFSIYHPVGTARMGEVVDNELRVIGVSGLRVIDASVMPTTVSGNTNAPTIMIGEKGADMIKRAWLQY